jgi:hypothetical protein
LIEYHFLHRHTFSSAAPGIQNQQGELFPNSNRCLQEYTNQVSTKGMSTKSPIRYVIENPQLFGMELEEIRESYHRHREAIGVDGTAAWEITKKLYGAGWITASHHLGEGTEYWLFEFGKYSDSADLIYKFLTECVYNGFVLIPPVVMEHHGTEDHYFKFYSVAEGGVLAFVKKYEAGGTIGVDDSKSDDK